MFSLARLSREARAVAVDVLLTQAANRAEAVPSPDRRSIERPACPIKFSISPAVDRTLVDFGRFDGISVAVRNNFPDPATRCEKLGAA